MAAAGRAAREGGKAGRAAGGPDDVTRRWHRGGGGRWRLSPARRADRRSRAALRRAKTLASATAPVPARGRKEGHAPWLSAAREADPR